MSTLVRGLFFASLALVVGELALPGQGSTAITADAAAPLVEPVQVHHEPLPASYGARSWLPNRPADKRAGPVADAPFASSRATIRSLSPVDIRAAELSRFGPSTSTLLLLPPSRAPPALS